MRLLRAIDARYFAPAPAERLATVRVLTGSFAVIYLLVRGQVLADFRTAPGTFRPVGIAAWLSAPLPAGVAFALYLAALACGVAFTLGFCFRWTGPAFALLVLWVTTYRNGWGMIFHTDNLLVLHLGVLALSDAAAALSIDARRRRGLSAQAGRNQGLSAQAGRSQGLSIDALRSHGLPAQVHGREGLPAQVRGSRGLQVIASRQESLAAPHRSHELPRGPAAGEEQSAATLPGAEPPEARIAATAPAALGSHELPFDRARFGWPLRLISILTALAYLLAAVAKLKVTGLGWMDGDVLRNYIAYDAMRKSQIGSIHSPFGAWLVQFAWPFPLLSVFSMLLELSGPLALLWPRTARAWALGLYGFHVGVFASMAIAFPYPLSGVAFASIVECERLWRLGPLRRAHHWLSGSTCTPARSE